MCLYACSCCMHVCVCALWVPCVWVLMYMLVVCSVCVHAHTDDLVDSSIICSFGCDIGFLYGWHLKQLQVVWGKISMVDAEKRLLANALQDNDNQHFVLLSDRWLAWKIDMIPDVVEKRSWPSLEIFWHI